MLVTFLSAMIIGIVGLMWSFIFDHDHGFDHADHDGSHYLSTKVVCTFLASFGAIGALSRVVGHGAIASTTWAVLGGIAFGFLMSMLLAYIGKQQSTSHITSAQLINQVGYTETSMTLTNPLGEVSVVCGPATQRHLARSDGGKEILSGTKIQVVGISGNEVIVRPIQ